MRFSGIVVRACLVALPTIVLGEEPEFALSDKDLEIGGGYWTSGGKYRGGIPKVGGVSATFDFCEEFGTNEEEQANSTSTTANGGGALVCIEWIMNKPQTPQTGDLMDECYCNDVNDNYCAQSTCDKIRLDLSDSCSGEDDDDDSFRRRNLQECQERLSVGAVRCHCNKEFKETRLFCPSWTCQDYSTGDEVKEVYECITGSTNGLYCQEWTTVIDGPEYFGQRACECTQETSGADGLCAVSSCKVKGITKCSICSLKTSIAAFGIVGSLGILMLCSRCFSKEPGAKRSFCVFFSIFWILGACTGAGLYGGQDGGMYVGIMWVGVIASYVFCCRPPAERESNVKTLPTVNR